MYSFIHSPSSSVVSNTQSSHKKKRMKREVEEDEEKKEHKSSLKVKFENETCYDLFRVINNLEDLVHLKNEMRVILNEKCS